MTRLSRLFKDYKESGAFSSLVNLFGFIDGRTFLTKSGDLGLVLRIEGIEYECLDPEELDRIARRFEAAMRLFGPRFRIYQHLIKSNDAEVPDSLPEGPVVREAVRSRSLYLKGKAGRLYRQEAFFTIVFEGARAKAGTLQKISRLLRDPRGGLAALFSTAGAVALLEEEIEQGRRELAGKVEAFALQIGDFLGVEMLGKQGAFGFFRRLLNFSPLKQAHARLHTDLFLDFFLCDSHLECHRDRLLLDDFHVKALTLKEPPARSFAHLLRAAEEIPSCYVMASEWQARENGEMRRLIQSKRRHFHNSKHSMLNYLGQTDRPPAPGELLADTSKAALVDDLGRCLEELEVEGRHFGEFSWSIVLYDLDPARLGKSVARCVKAFSAEDASLTEERYNLLNAYLAAIPGNAAFNLRRLYLLNTNHADLSFLFASHPGEGTNYHLGRECLAVLESEQRSPYFLNLHSGDLAHTLILGATGSGKSFLLNFLVTHLQRYSPRTAIFDLGGGYETLTRLFGGASVKVRLDRLSFSVNPFRLPPTKENRQFLFSFVRLLIQSDGGERMTGAQERDLYEQIGSLYEVDPAQRRLFTLASILKREAGRRLDRWVEGGQYEGIFDNEGDSLTFAEFQSFDFEGLESCPEVLEPLLFYILHRASASVHSPEEATRLKVFVMDEAWRFLRDEGLKQYVVQALKTWRKRNAAVILATQSSGDLEAGGMLQAAVESAATFLFLANPGVDQEEFRRLFHLNKAEAAKIASLTPKRQMLLKQGGRSKVLNLNVEERGYWLYTSDPFDQQRRREAFERHGFERGLEALCRNTTPLKRRNLP